MTTPNYSDPAIALRELVRPVRLLLVALDISEMGPSIKSEQAVEDARAAVQIAMEGIWNARVALALNRRVARPSFLPEMQP